MNWRDEHPDRYGPVSNGDMVVMGGFADGLHHFVRVYCPDASPITPLYVACDAPMPLERGPMEGVVDCPRCLAAWRKAENAA